MGEYEKPSIASESLQKNEAVEPTVTKLSENNESSSLAPSPAVLFENNETMLPPSKVADHIVPKEQVKISDNKEASSGKYAGETERLSRAVSAGIRTKREAPVSGIIYLSRIPPGMEPNALRSLLTPVGGVKRMWLRPENNVNGKSGQIGGGSNKKDNEKRQRWQKSVFRDGWVEFASRRYAKRAVELLNGQPMVGAKRRGRYADDFWAMRFLPGFTWDDLRHELLGSARERVLQVREEVASARRERAWVESRTALRKHIDKRSRKSTNPPKPVRHFRQKAAIGAKCVDDEKRAAAAAIHVDNEIESGVARKLDEGLIAKLFKRKVTGKSS